MSIVTEKKITCKPQVDLTWHYYKYQEEELLGEKQLLNKILTKNLEMSMTYSTF